MKIKHFFNTAAVCSLILFSAVSCASDSNSNDEEFLNAVLGSDFVRGFDVSSADYWENVQATKDDWADPQWYDTDGSQKSIYEILANHGINTVRIRVWVSPENAKVTDEYWATSPNQKSEAWQSGDNTTERAVRMAKKATEAGLKILLDFHYSDYWTDPGKQLIPSEWLSSTTVSDMAEHIKSYTTEVLTALKNEGITPSYVQVGNEIDSGILLHKEYNTSSGTTDADNSIAGKMGNNNFATYLKAGCKAVRDFDSNIKIILHITNEHAVWGFNQIKKHDIDYDIMGLSYYPWEKNHGSVSDLRNNIKTLRSAINKPVMVVESSTHFDSERGNYNFDLQMAAEHLINPRTGRIYSNLETENVKGKTQIVGSVENQKKIYKHLMQEIYDVGGSGIFAWGGERRGDWKYAFFTWEGKALESLDVFKEN